jgi:hypothetical protein
MLMRHFSPSVFFWRTAQNQEEGVEGNKPCGTPG